MEGGAIRAAIQPELFECGMRLSRRGRSALRSLLKLTRFRGHRTVCVQGVHDGQDEIAVCTRIPSPDGGTGARRPYGGEAQSERNAGRGDGGLTTAEREELTD
jgi:hypothetical protein